MTRAHGWRTHGRPPGRTPDGQIGANLKIYGGTVDAVNGSRVKCRSDGELRRAPARRSARPAPPASGRSCRSAPHRSPGPSASRPARRAGRAARSPRRSPSSAGRRPSRWISRRRARSHGSATRKTLSVGVRERPRCRCRARRPRRRARPRPPAPARSPRRAPPASAPRARRARVTLAPRSSASAGSPSMRTLNDVLLGPERDAIGPARRASASVHCVRRRAGAQHAPPSAAR